MHSLFHGSGCKPFLTTGYIYPASEPPIYPYNAIAVVRRLQICEKSKSSSGSLSVFILRFPFNSAVCGERFGFSLNRVSSRYALTMIDALSSFFSQREMSGTWMVEMVERKCVRGDCWK